MELVDKIGYSLCLHITWLCLYYALFRRGEKLRWSGALQIGTLTAVRTLCFFYTIPVEAVASVVLLLLFSRQGSRKPAKKLFVEVVFVYVVVTITFTLCSMLSYTAMTLLFGGVADIAVTLCTCALSVPVHIVMCRILRRQKAEQISENFFVGIFATAAILITISLQVMRIPYVEPTRQRGLFAFALCVIVVSFALVFQWLWREHKAAQERERLIRAAREASEECQALKSENHKLNKVITTTQQGYETMQRKLERFREPGLHQELSQEIAAGLDAATLLKRDIEDGVEQALCLYLEPDTGIPALDEDVRQLARTMAAQGVRFDCVFRATLEEFLFTKALSALDLRQSVTNLISNAINAVCRRQTGRAVVTMSCTKQGGIIRLRVSDSGGYFDPAVLRHLGQGGNTTGGSGFGLVNVLQMLERCGGSFSVEEFLPPRANGYTKSITLSFDGAARIRVSSPRAEVESYATDLKEKLAQETFRIGENLCVSDR